VRSWIFALPHQISTIFHQIMPEINNISAQEKLISGDEDGARAFLADKVKAEVTVCLCLCVV
jgi:hypothetical protein